MAGEPATVEPSVDLRRELFWLRTGNIGLIRSYARRGVTPWHLKEFGSTVNFFVDKREVVLLRCRDGAVTGSLQAVSLQAVSQGYG